MATMPCCSDERLMGRVGSDTGDTVGPPARKERFDSDFDAYPIAPLLFNCQDVLSLRSAKQLEVVEVNMRTAAELNHLWHSMLPRTDLGNLLCGNTSVAYAAQFAGHYWATAIWSQPIIAALCDGHTIELRRLAVCDAAPPNTASRMLGVMRKTVAKRYPQMRKAISYLAVDQHKGTIYKAAGWEPVGEVVAARPQRMTGGKQRATGPLQTKSRKQRWECVLSKSA